MKCSTYESDLLGTDSARPRCGAPMMTSLTLSRQGGDKAAEEETKALTDPPAVASAPAPTGIHAETRAIIAGRYRTLERVVKAEWAPFTKATISRWWSGGSQDHPSGGGKQSSRTGAF